MRKLLSAVLIAAIVAGSLLLALLMYRAKAAPKRKQPADRGVAVETLVARKKRHRLDVKASGLVVPAESLTVTPELSGRIVWLYRDLTPGTFVKKGQRLFRIDARQYAQEVARTAASVTVAESELALELGRQRAAKEELDLLEGQDRQRPVEAPELVLRKPQQKSAEGSLAMAKANLGTARLNLARTTFSAPFDAVIVESSVARGQLVTPQTQICQLAATDRVHVRVSVAMNKIPHVVIPGIDGDEGAPVLVRQRVGERVVERQGRVLRLMSSLQPESAMARLLLEVDDPFGLKQTKEDRRRPYPLLLQSQVAVTIEGREARQLVELPRSAVRNGSVAYVAVPAKAADSSAGGGARPEHGATRAGQGAKGEAAGQAAVDGGARTAPQLEVRQLTIVWERPETVLVSNGVEPGDQVITSPLSGAVPGMKLRPAPRASAADD